MVDLGWLEDRWLMSEFLIQKSTLSFIHHFKGLFGTNSNQLSVGFLAQLVEHCTGIAVVIGLNPV